MSTSAAHARADCGRRVRLCAYVSRFGMRCGATARAESAYCQHHRCGELLQLRELYVLCDPRTGEPVEVTW